MNRVHIIIGNGQASQYEESHVMSMLQQGILREDALYWKEGMTEWMPLRNLYPRDEIAEQIESSFQPETKEPNYKFTKNPMGLTRTLKALLWVQLFVAAIAVMSDIAQLNLIGRSSVTTEVAEANDARQSLIRLTYLIVYLLTAIAFLKWIHQANTNCRGFGALDM